MDRLFKRPLKNASKEQLIAIIEILYDLGNPVILSMPMCDIVNYLNGKKDGLVRAGLKCIDLKRIRYEQKR